MEANQVLALKGSANVELNEDEKYVDFSEYGNHVFRLSYEEIKMLNSIINTD